MARRFAERNPLSTFLGFCVLSSLPLVGMLHVWQRLGWSWPLWLYAGASLAAFTLYLRDKRKARQGARRTPENLLHLCELLGGWPGALLAQHAFRHKTRKRSFQLGFWCVVALHQAFWGRYLWRLVA